MTINYDGRVFRGETNSDNGEVGGETVFFYRQQGQRLEATYRGGAVVQGHLMGSVNDDDTLDFVYHHINDRGETMAGQCHSVPERATDGRIILHESWQWLTGDRSSGESIVGEIDPEDVALHDDPAGPLAQALLTQYAAAFKTLEEAIERFPEPSWQQDHPDDSADRAVFHTLFFTDYYLGSGPEAFRQQPYHAENPAPFQDYEELEDRQPQNHYDREACRQYLEFCRRKAHRVLAGASCDTLSRDSGFPGRDLSRLGLHVYTIRHIQHHAAQLGLRLQLAGGEPLRWQSR
jgi:hypothetical protein